jgi:ABC-type uncharacterized transport system substrate-binding protein
VHDPALIYLNKLSCFDKKLCEICGPNLKGKSAGRLASRTSAGFRIIVNLKAAKQLGISVPPALLARANEAIE